MGQFCKENTRPRSLFRVKDVKLLGTVSGFSLSCRMRFSACTIPVVSKRVQHFLESSKVVGIDHSLERLSCGDLRTERGVAEVLKERPALGRLSRRLRVSYRRVIRTVRSSIRMRSVCGPVRRGRKDRVLLVSGLRRGSERRRGILSQVMLGRMLRALRTGRQAVVCLECFTKGARTRVKGGVKVSRIRISEARGGILRQVQGRVGQ